MKPVRALLGPHLSPQLLDLRGQLFALLSVLPLGGLLRFDYLEEVEVLLLQLLLLQEQLVEAGVSYRLDPVLAVHLVEGTELVLALVLLPV